MATARFRIEDYDDFSQAVERCTGLKIERIDRLTRHQVGLLPSFGTESLLTQHGAIRLIHWVGKAGRVQATLYLIEGTPFIDDRAKKLPPTDDGACAKSWSATL